MVQFHGCKVMGVRELTPPLLTPPKYFDSPSTDHLIPGYLGGSIRTSCPPLLEIMSKIFKNTTENATSDLFSECRDTIVIPHPSPSDIWRRKLLLLSLAPHTFCGGNVPDSEVLAHLCKYGRSLESLCAQILF